MAMLGYLFLGSVVYAIGVMIYLKVIRPKKLTLSLLSPLLIQLLLGCFLLMCGISAVIGRFLLSHQGFDWAYILVNSGVATAIFYFGLTPDESSLKLPD